MFNPLMDVSSLSEKDIVERLGIAQQRLSAAARFGMNQQIMDQLRNTMMILQVELADRAETTEPLGDRGCAWDMDKYVEENRNEKTTQQDDTPRWQSFAYDEHGDEGNEQWDPTLPD